MIYYKEADFTQYAQEKKLRKIVTYANYPAALDTETSEYNEKAWLYIWQIGIGDTIVYGRTPEELQECLLKIVVEMNLNYYCRLIMYVHDLRYDFAFLKGYLNINYENSTLNSDWIAKSNRQIIKCLVNGCIELRCSYSYTETSLANMGEIVGLPKLDLDYTKIRTPETPLTEEELKYCQRDIEILLAYFYRELEEFKHMRYIPITATSKVRRELDREGRKQDSSFDRKGNGYEANYNLGCQQIYYNNNNKVEDMYKYLKYATFGGYTFANRRGLNHDYTNIRSCDGNSLYPSIIIWNKFPIGYFKQKEAVNQALYTLGYNFTTTRKNKQIELIEAQFYGVKATSDYFRFIPREKIIEWRSDSIENNNIKFIDNKLEYASYVKLCLWDVDYTNFIKYYNPELIVVNRVWVASAAYVPEYYSDTILKLFRAKNEEKDYRTNLNRDTTAEEDEYYTNLKRHLNRMAYGIAVQSPERKIRRFDQEKKEMYIDHDKGIDIGFHKYTQFQWGSLITAYGRNILLSLVDQMTEGGKIRSVLYCDTDSIKFKDSLENMDIINNYNIELKKNIFAQCKRRGRNNVLFNYDKLKKLGELQDEGLYKHFKIAAMKAYFYIAQNNTSKIKCSGLNRNQTYLHTITYKDGYYIDRATGEVVTEDEAININMETLQKFNKDLYIPKKHLPKYQNVYSDTPESFKVCDYLGHEATVHTSGFCLIKYSDFELNPDPVESFLKDLNNDKVNQDLVCKVISKIVEAIHK